MVSTAARSARPTTIVTRGNEAVCAVMHTDSHRLAFNRRLCWHVRLDVGTGGSVHLGTARWETGAYTASMQLRSIQVFIAAMWVLFMAVAGIAADANSFRVWTVLAGVALFPPFVMMRWWSDPRQSMSPSIQEARR